MTKGTSLPPEEVLPFPKLRERVMIWKQHPSPSDQSCHGVVIFCARWCQNSNNSCPFWQNKMCPSQPGSLLWWKQVEIIPYMIDDLGSASKDSSSCPASPGNLAWHPSWLQCWQCLLTHKMMGPSTLHLWFDDSPLQQDNRSHYSKAITEPRWLSSMGKGGFSWDKGFKIHWNAHPFVGAEMIRIKKESWEMRSGQVTKRRAVSGLQHMNQPTPKINWW